MKYIYENLSHATFTDIAKITNNPLQVRKAKFICRVEVGRL